MRTTWSLIRNERESETVDATIVVAILPVAGVPGSFEVRRRHATIC